MLKSFVPVLALAAVISGCLLVGCAVPAPWPSSPLYKPPTDDPDWLEKSEASTAWNGATLHLHYAKALEEQCPEVATLFQNFQMNGDDLSAMGKALAVDGQEAAEFAKEWVAANEDTVLNWLTN